MKFTLGISPCPNDTFIFDALVNQKIDTQGISFEVRLEDVQTLNEWALEGKLDISKISYGVLPQAAQHYKLLQSGGALGKGVGPLLITTAEKTMDKEVNPEEWLVAIPGENTTAHLLFSLAYPDAKKKSFLVFHEIEDAVLSGKVDAGVIIHENRFTYAAKGLKKVMDLGAYWEGKLEVPIPLGGIVMHKRYDAATMRSVDEMIHQSLRYAFARYPAVSDYVKQHAQEMEEQVMRQHIDLYVNQYSLDLGVEGKKAVQVLLDVHGESKGTERLCVEDVLVNESADKHT